MYILTSSDGQTAEKISEILGCKCGTKAPKKSDFIVRYGRAKRKADLNSKIILDKLYANSLLSKAVRTPKLIDVSIPLKQYFPILGRELIHSRGHGITIIKNFKQLKDNYTCDYFTQYIPKKAEFRAHVLGNSVKSVSIKVKEGKSKGYVWSFDNGWKHKEYKGLWKWFIGRIAKKAVRALGYDFGAVDIILGKDNKLYVLEVNSAPRLNKKRREIYAKYFKKVYDKRRK